jgi:hypothetical protein
MKYRLLAAGCVAYAVALLATLHVAPSPARMGLYATYAVAAIASWVTAFSYGGRDRLRWAWLAFGSGYAIAFASKVFVGDNLDVFTFSPVRAVMWSAMVFLLNVGSVTAFALFASVWSGTGVAPRWRRRATLIFLALAHQRARHDDAVVARVRRLRLHRR